MTDSARSSFASPGPLGGAGTLPYQPADPRQAFRSALLRYQLDRLEGILSLRGLEQETPRPNTLTAQLVSQLDSPAEVTRLLTYLSPSSRLVLSLSALAETPTWPLLGLWHSLLVLGVEPRSALLETLELGLVALEIPYEFSTMDGLARWLDPQSPHAFHVNLIVHPSVAQGVRVTTPQERLTPYSGTVGQIRESDGLEPLIRLGAVWQRVRLEPLRQTQQGTLYKRDQERIDDDPIFCDPSNDALEPVPALPAFWLALARRVGLIVADPSGERLLAAEPEFWTENAIHLPQMISTNWLGMRSWREWAPGPGEPPDAGVTLAFLRIPLLLWLATLAVDEWVALEQLAEHLKTNYPQWDRLSLAAESGTAPLYPRRGPAARGKSDVPSASRLARGERILRSVLLGAALPLGLVRAAAERDSGRTVVQLSPLGRYVLALGPPPPPRPAFEHFLFVQPNLEIIAYRQGLTPQLVGRLSRFAWWTKIGAAVELKLSQESAVLGFEAGLSPEQMINLLTQHSHRPLPGLVPDAIGRWASRREQITVYTAATLLEFNAPEERDQALVAWSEIDPKNLLPVADRFLLVENPQCIPTDRIRTSGSRDYRLPPQKCVSIEADGVTLALDITRSDLLIDAELSRFADALPDRPLRASEPAVRRYLVCPASLARAVDFGITSTQIADWFVRRTSEPPSPALKLLLRPTLAQTLSLQTRRTLVVITPTAEIADGLIQHPATRDLVAARLGPTALSVTDENLEALRKKLKELHITLDLP